jgi:hypothetical protein
VATIGSEVISSNPSLASNEVSKAGAEVGRHSAASGNPAPRLARFLIKLLTELLYLNVG